MFWADRIVSEIKNTKAAKEATSEKPLIVRDEKTLSGRVHVGSMRGVAIHGLLAEILNTDGVPTHFIFELNDFDPFDNVPGYLDPDTYAPHLGKPLYTVPSPEPGFANYAEYYGAEFVGVHEKAGFIPEYYRTTELYQSGKMDALIRTALERKDHIRRILKEVSGSVKNETWLPVSVICEQCGKMMTTDASDFDGETVAYACVRNPDGAVACGHSGRISPFSGNAKLFWKVDWAAKWIAVGVDVEGAGKDHGTKGGSRDVADHIAREIFNHKPPYGFAYEFFLVGGKKMSSSKGRGSSAKEMSDLFPPEEFRMLLIGKDYNQQINVDPEGDSIPRMYDSYDDAETHLESGDDFARAYVLSQVPKNQAGVKNNWHMRFSEVAFISQMPHLALEKEAERVKGSSLTDEENRLLQERAQYAQFWLSTYAPEQYRFVLQETTPTIDLSETQKKALAALVDYMETDRSGEDIHKRLHELKTEVPIQPKDLFTAIYRVFLNRDSGPQAGWFLSVLPREFVEKRLQEAAR